MNAILSLLVDLLSTASIMIGLISFIGLVLQKESPTKIINGTLKTIVGFLVFTIGSSAATVALNDFQALFAKGFHLQGVLPLAEAVTALAQQRFGTVVALVMTLGFVVNLIVARLTPMKYIFLTGQHNLYLAALSTIMLKSVGLSNPYIVVIGGIIVGFMSAAMPAIAQPGMRKVTGGDDIALAHYVSIGYALSSWIGGKVGSPKESTEKLKLPGWLSIFKDYVIGVSITMVIFYYIAALFAGKAQVEQLSKGVNWLIYPLLQGLQFAAALYVIITGVRLLLGEIVNAFVGISEKLIPNAKPALDVPVVFPYAPTATVIGFVSAYAAGLLMMDAGICGSTYARNHSRCSALLFHWCYSRRFWQCHGRLERLRYWFFYRRYLNRSRSIPSISSIIVNWLKRNCFSGNRFQRRCLNY